MAALCLSVVHVFLSSWLISCFSTLEHRASMQQCQWTLFPTIVLTSLQVFFHCFSFVVNHSPPAPSLSFMGFLSSSHNYILCYKSILNNTIWKCVSVLHQLAHLLKVWMNSDLCLALYLLTWKKFHKFCECLCCECTPSSCLVFI